MRTRIVLPRFISTRLFHLLPCSKDIGPRLCIFSPCIRTLRCWRRAEVFAREPVRPAVKCIVMLWWRRTLGLRSRFGRRRAVVGSARGRRCIGISGGWGWSGSWSIRCIRGNGQISIFPSLGIVLCSLCRIAEHFVGSLDFLKLDNKLGFPPRIAVWVVLKRKGSECLADLIFACVRGDV